MKSKQQLRIEARARRARLAADVSHFADAIARFADELDIAMGAAVAGYWPVRDEADPRVLMRGFAKREYPVALPCVVARAAPLVFHLWNEGDVLVRNAHGVCEVPHGAAEIVPQAVLVPLLAFDADGFRLGYGGGYYDRTLENLRAAGRISAIGIAYAGQMVDALPRDAHDHRLDLVLTELGVVRFQG